MPSEDVLSAKIEIRVAWWWPIYVDMLVFFAVLTQREPDWEKLMNVTSRAIQFRFVGGKRWHRIVD